MDTMDNGGEIPLLWWDAPHEPVSYQNSSIYHYREKRSNLLATFVRLYSHPKTPKPFGVRAFW
jgi:hypothetical protein